VALVHDGRIVVANVRRADSFRDRFFGLMGKHQVDADEGLLLAHTSSIHMFFMRTAIDAIFLGPPTSDGTQSIVALRRRLRPWRGLVPFVRGARDCLELAPGAIDRAKLVVGDDVRLEPSPAA
jgi:uncharacterized membrane protein (UPF0127 family)